MYETAEDSASAQLCICAGDVSSFVSVLLVNLYLHGMGYQSYEKQRKSEKEIKATSRGPRERV